ncbi:hypothetical protein SDC9_194982 [bioreactor metagenome]|uniref:Uncharacterized protein n=1 Tax=bioreactor metagenome TaxID=1076179 RepID=A0A645I8C0_9ZZZZ
MGNPLGKSHILRHLIFQGAKGVLAHPVRKFRVILRLTEVALVERIAVWQDTLVDEMD